MLCGEGAGAGVLGKELRDRELKDEDWSSGPAGTMVAGGDLGEEAVGSGKLESKDAV